MGTNQWRPAAVLTARTTSPQTSRLVVASSEELDDASTTALDEIRGVGQGGQHVHRWENGWTGECLLRSWLYIFFFLLSLKSMNWYFWFSLLCRSSKPYRSNWHWDDNVQGQLGQWDSLWPKVLKALPMTTFLILKWGAIIELDQSGSLRLTVLVVQINSVRRLYYLPPHFLRYWNSGIWGNL